MIDKDFQCIDCKNYYSSYETLQKHRRLNCPVLYPEKVEAIAKVKDAKRRRAEERAKEKEDKITIEDELHKPIKRFFPTRKIIVDKIDDTWGCDTMFIPKNTKSTQETDEKKIQENLINEKKRLDELEEKEKIQAEREGRKPTSREGLRQKGGTTHIFLIVIDIFSRFAWVRILKNGSSAETLNALNDIIESSNSKPLKLWTDKGSEFKGLVIPRKKQTKTDYQCEDCKEYFKTENELNEHILYKCPVIIQSKEVKIPTKIEGVSIYFAYGKNKVSIAERFIKTLKGKIGRWMTKNNSVDFLPHIQEIVKKYNETPHSNFKKNYTPTEARDPKNEKKIYELYYSTPNITKFKTDLNINDLVRTVRTKGGGDDDDAKLKEKGFTSNWSKEIFKIYDIKNTIPPVYYLKDNKGKKIIGGFYREELQKTKFPMTEEMGYSKTRVKNNVLKGLEKQLSEAYRQKLKQQRKAATKEKIKCQYCGAEVFNLESHQKSKKCLKAQQQLNQQPQPSTSQEGQGLESELLKNIPIKSLTNLELINICKNFKGWRGVFSRDTLPKNLNLYECGIVNLDDSEGPGTHWVAYLRNKKLKFYFDSYGLPPPLEIKNYLKSPILYSSDQIQDPNSVICGHLCIYVLEKLSNGWHIQPIINQLLDLKEEGHL